MIHELKTWPGVYQATLDKKKKAEFRKNDQGFEVNDILILREWEPDKQSYTGRTLKVRVVHIVRGPDFGIPDGYVMMSIVFV